MNEYKNYLQNVRQGDFINVPNEGKGGKGKAKERAPEAARGSGDGSGADDVGHVVLPTPRDARQEGSG